VIARSGALARARAQFGVGDNGLPWCADAQAAVAAIDDLLRVEAARAVELLLGGELLRGSDERYHDILAPRMRRVPGGRFLMGTPAAEAGHFCGESPRHEVELGAFSMLETAVTNELFQLFDPRPRDPDGDTDGGGPRPVVGVTWLEATLFAAWLGCRLPTEAEWEYACAGGSPAPWCCASEADLGRYAWYSANSDGVVHDAATLEPNLFGLFDCHGNVWEWCLDSYDQDYYARARLHDPVNADSADRQPGSGFPEKVCRGGAVTSLSEMCRTRYRLHEAADFSATDLGFRLVRGAGRSDLGGGHED
jgi:formylglycine-generating enzyme required for sulfatase activity